MKVICFDDYNLLTIAIMCASFCQIKLLSAISAS